MNRFSPAVGSGQSGPAAICDSGLEVSLGMRGKLTVFSIAATATWSSSWWGKKIGMGGASGLAWTELEND